MVRIRPAALLFASTIALTGCGAIGAKGTYVATVTPAVIVFPARTPFPAPGGAEPLGLATVPPAAPVPSGLAAPCPAALLVPARVVVDTGAVKLVNQATGQTIAAVWPRGFAAWSVDGMAEVISPDGTIVAHAGDVLSDLGGTVDDICSVHGVIYGPAS